MPRAPKAAAVCAALLCFASQQGGAQPPAGYYDSVDATSPATLRATLHPVIDDHTRFPYTSGATDTWDILEMADEDPADSGRILDVYKNASYAKVGGGNPSYNREHSWPNSYGFPDDVPGNYPYTDCHALFLSDSAYNSSRGNNPFRSCPSGCSEQPTQANNGQGGGTGVYPGNSNWWTGSGASGTWETWIGRRGDVARALLYLDIRYEGGTHGITGAAEPDLILTDDGSLIQTSGGVNASVAYMGYLSTLLAWHTQDPVSAEEVWRNEVVFLFQGNRNPFTDHPEWVGCLFLGDCTALLFADGFESGNTSAWTATVP
jgi:endonuclease I